MALSKNTIKTLKALHRKKFRQKYNNFIAEGDKIVGELIRQQHYPVQEVFSLPEWLAVNEPLLRENRIPFSLINDTELRLISQLTSPNQVLAVIGQPAAEKPVDWSDNWSLYLDGLQDPGNVGTILRIADWFAIPRVIARPGTVELFNAKVLQATMGAFLRVQWVEQDLAAIRTAAPALPIWAADMGGEDIFKVDVPKSRHIGHRQRRPRPQRAGQSNGRPAGGHHRPSGKWRRVVECWGGYGDTLCCAAEGGRVSCRTVL